MSNFKDLNLSTQIVEALEKKGYTHPTPIQAQSIPHLLAGKDLLGIAQTGTGKTAAFALPIIDNLFKSGKTVEHNNVRTLILTPTRELASQIADNIKIYSQDSKLKTAVIFGGVRENAQIKNAKNGFDILVATPGRLLDLASHGHVKFSNLEIFVLDEADRMLDMGFIHDVKKLIAKLPAKRQNLFFSATMPKDVAALANSILNDPVRVEVTPESTTVEKIDQQVNLVEKANKPLLLKSIVENSEPKDLFLVFSKTKHGANRIVEFLDKNKIKALAIHGNKSQGAREKALEGFRQGNIKVLVATDIAARGIDVSGITHVINYDIPNHPESYVHRIGRTGRAGREGIAISFCDNSERNLLKDIEKIIAITIPVDENHPFHGVKASAEAKSALPMKDRPRSGYRSTPKPAFKGDREREPSHFAKNRRWKDGDNRSSRPRSNNERSPFEVAEPRDFVKRDDYKSKDRTPRDGSSRESNFGSKPRFRSDDSRPRFSDDRRPSSFSDRKPRFESSDRPRRDFSDKPRDFSDRPKRDFSDRPRRDFSDRKPSEFGGRDRGFGIERRGSSDRSDRPFRSNSDRPRRDFSDKPRDFSDRPKRDFSDRKPRFEGSDDRRSNSFSGDRRDRFSSDRSSGGRFENKFNDRSERSSFGENKPRGFKSNSSSEGRSFSKPRTGGFGGKKPGGFGGKSGGGFKPKRPNR